MYERTRDWQLHRPIEHTLSKYAITTESHPTLDDDTIARVMAAYNASMQTEVGVGDWVKLYGKMKADVHASLASKDIARARTVLSDPASNFMHYGFENIYRGVIEQTEPHHILAAHIVYNSIRRLAEAVGAIKLEDPEHYAVLDSPPEPPGVEDMLTKLDSAFGFKIDFPNPYRNEVGYDTSRGIASYRAIQSLYQVWRIRNIVQDIASPVIVEIGAGLGRNAYYAYRSGIQNYTIVDIPMTAAAQSYFLLSTVGPGNLHLYGEEGPSAISILPPKAFLESGQRVDLVLNVDSLPEMPAEVGRAYFNKISQCTNMFLSINRENFAVIVSDFYKEHGRCRVLRHPYWMRRGYADELISFDRMR